MTTKILIEVEVPEGATQSVISIFNTWVFPAEPLPFRILNSAQAGPDGLCIWWTAHRDCALIGDEPLPHWPRYLREQYTQRLGRSGRGRLWIAEGMKTSVDPWPDTLIARTIESESAAGIVIHSADAALIGGLPGFITDTRLNFI